MSDGHGQDTRDQLSRMDAKLDVLISQHGQVAGMVADHETRLRSVETEQITLGAAVTELGKDSTDHEERLRAADRWRYGMPVAALGALLAGCAAVIQAVKG